MTMKKVWNRFLESDFCRVFNFRTEEAKGRSLMLIQAALNNIGSAVISGALYTAFLAENGIDIVRVGIIAFIPYISWMLSVFSPMVLAKIRNRQAALMFNHIFYYLTVVIATTVMPLFVQDPLQKTIWFAVFIFLGNASNALLGAGNTAWIIRFIPRGRELNSYTAYSNLISNIMATVTGIGGSLVAMALEESGHQLWFLFWLRIIAAILFVVGGYLVFIVAKGEKVAPPKERILPQHVLTKPFQHRPFVLCMLIVIFWNASTSLNGSTFTYYIIETVRAPMWLPYLGSLSSMVASILFTEKLRRYMDRTSPFRIMAVFLLMYTTMEVFYVFVHPNTVPLYCVLVALSGVAGVGFGLGFNNLFYMHLPEGSNKDLYATCWHMVGNIAALAGTVAGTWILSVFEAHGVINIGGWTFYGSQLICFIKIFCFGGVFLYVHKMTPRLQIREE